MVTDPTAQIRLSELARVQADRDRLAARMDRLCRIETFARLVGEEWRQQHKVNPAMLDVLAEVVRHG